jgi:phosphoglycerate dehydrogenase-like enzyme
MPERMATSIAARRFDIVLTPALPDPIVELARSVLPGSVEVADPDRERERALELFGAAEFLIGFPWDLDEESFAALSTRCRLIQLLSAGYDDFDVAGAARHGLPVALNGGANAVAVAEHTVMLMLAALRRLWPLATEVKNFIWRSSLRSGEWTHELAGRTVGLIGLGNIGREVAARLAPFGVVVLYHDVNQVPTEVEDALGARYVPLDELLKRSDVVSLHLPLLPATRRLLDRDRLMLMPRGAVLVNTARGELVDERALADLLSEGHLFAAGLDTTAVEPPPPDHPLPGLDNCLITPHSAGPTWESWARRLRNAADNLSRVAAGSPPLWLIPGLEGTHLENAAMGGPHHA